ncbi:MAG: CotH kinase family protein [Lachnospiraceae bacterium]|nr:CotH kinase family protein [Lachnospiraceae bacterium]
MRKWFNRYLHVVLLIFFALIITLAVCRSLWSDGRHVLINEVCASNLSTVSDNYGRYPDWIELYNPTSEDVDITGWRLSKNKALDSGWTIDGKIVPANGYLIIFADSDGVDGEADFSISSEGTAISLTTPSGRVIDEIDVPYLKPDTVWGRIRDGDSKWDRLTPTPIASNDSAVSLKETLNAAVNFSESSGFYDEDFKLSLSTEPGLTIRYTLDGSEPDSDSEKYTAPLEITDASKNENVYSASEDVAIRTYIPSKPVDKAVVVRAAAFDDSGKKSDSYTSVYFVGYDKKEKYDGISVVSLVSDPEGLFSYENGIYVLGKTYADYVTSGAEESYDKAGIWWWTPGNYHLAGRKAERAAVVSFFDENHELELTQALGVRIKGGGSRGYAQKSFNLFARGAYGDSYFDKNLIAGDRKEKSISLFSGGDDLSTKLKDMLFADIMKDSSAAVLEGKPAAVFLDGEYWGLYWIAQKYSKTYFSDKYGVDENNVIMIKNDAVGAGDPEDKELYDELTTYVTHADLNDPAVYEEFKKRVDIDSLLDYYTAQIYIAHTNDWPGSNVGMWRVRETGNGEYEDGKWRFCIFDVNSTSMDLENVELESLTEVSGKNWLLKSLMKSEQFRKDFKERFDEISTELFDTEQVNAKIDSLAELIRPQMELTYERYYSGKKTISDFDAEVDKLKEFYEKRYEYIVKDVELNCK